MKTPISNLITSLVLLFTFSFPRSTALAQGTAFTYQGRLNDGTNPANGVYDFTFLLFGASSGGGPVAGPITNSGTAVSNGLFIVTLDFGDQFSGANRWLEIGVRSNGGGNFDTQVPRQRVLPSPYAIHALTLSAGGLSGGSYANSFIFSNPLNSFVGTHSGDGSQLRGIHSLDAYDGSPTNALFVNASGQVGIGTTNPVSALQVNGGVIIPSPSISSVSSVAGSNLLNLIIGGGSNPVATNGSLNGISFYEGGTFSAAMSLGYDGSGNSAENALRVYHSSGNPLFTFEASGEIGIGTTKPSAPLHAVGIIRTDTQLSVGNTAQIRATESGTDGADLWLRDALGQVTVDLDADGGGGGSTLTMKNGNGVTTVSIDADQTDAAYMALMKADGSEGIVLDADNSIGGSLVAAQVMRITGGADIAEPFEITGEGLKPGMVVAIDPERPGQLTLARSPYDRKLAGIISGAGGIQTGLMLGQKNSVANGTHPVALTGRVYCWCDASNGMIAPGDLLTSSEIPGHAMKATDWDRAPGAILGKAMSSLDKGRGLVLVLVNLH